MRKRLLLLLPLLILVGCLPLLAQNGRSVSAQQIPQTAAALPAFVPPGWKIEQELTADLNADARPDRVLTLIETKSPDPQDDTRYRALLVLLARPEGGWLRTGLGGRVLRCTSCFGTFGGPKGGSPTVRIVKNVVVVDQLWGSRESTVLVQRFRYEPATGRMRLIGDDQTNTDRLSGQTVTVSTNLLTSQQEMQKGRVERKPTTTTRRTVRVPKVYLEDVDAEAEAKPSWLPAEIEGR